MAITAVRNVSCIRCFSPHREKRETFATAMQARLGTQFVAVATAEDAVAGSDVVLCATNSLQPVLSAEWLKPGLHISSLSRLELDASVVGAANVVFTHVRNAESRTVRTAGADLAKETEQRKTNLAVTIGQTELPELCDLLLGRREGRRSAEDITLFLNYAGLGYQFAATGHVIYTKARALGLGRELDTNLFTSAVPS